jgi:predicted O-methyltransferase YrrM
LLYLLGWFQVVLELGSFLGYSAIRIARTLPPGAKLITIEAKKENAAVATQAIARAGYADRVQVRMCEKILVKLNYCHFRVYCSRGWIAV